MPTSSVPFNTSPFVTVISTALRLLPPSNVPFTVTPFRTPARPLTTKAVPLVAVIVPPLTVPPFRYQAPPSTLTDRVVLVLLSVPVRFTVAPLALNDPRLVVANVPAKFTVPLEAVRVPVLVRLLLARASTPPLLTDNVPGTWFTSAAPANVIVPPLLAAATFPWL